MSQREASIKRNFIYNMLYELLVIVVPIFTTPYVSRILGAKNIGIYNYVTANLTYFTLIAAFGSATYAQREIAINRDDVEIRSKEFWGIFCFRLISTTAAYVVFAVFMLISNQYSSFYLIASISLISVALDISWFFQGLENFKVTVTRNSIIKILATLAIFAFVRTEDSLPIYIGINVLSVFLGNCTLWHFLRGKIKKVALSHLNLKKHLIGSLKLFIPVIAIQVYTVVDKTMLGILSDVVEVGYYSQAEKIVKIIITVINSLAVVLLPRLSALIGHLQFDEANKIYRKAIQFSVLLSLPCMAGCFILAKDFIPVFLGEGYDKSIINLQILSGLFMILGLARVIGTPLLIPLKREKKYTVAVCTGAVTNMLLNSFLIPLYGSTGASISTIVAELSVTILEVVFVADIFNPAVIFSSIRKYAVPTTIMIAVIIMIQNIMLYRVLRLFFSVICGGITYLGYLVIAKDPMLYDNLLVPLKKKLHLR